MPENDATQQTQAAEQPKYVTAEEVAKTVNAALTSHFKRQPDVAKLITESFAQYEARKQEEQAAKQAENDPGAKKVDPESIALKRQVDEMAKRLAKAEAETKAEREAKRAQSADMAIRTALAKHNVRPEAIDRLAKAYRADVQFDESGEPMLPFDGGATTIAAAIEADVKSKALDYAIAAPNAGGSGSARSGSQHGNGSIESIMSKPRNQWTADEEKRVFDERTRRLSVAAID